MPDATGLRFGALVALGPSHVENYLAYWVFRCDCGELTHKRLDNVRRGYGQSCGCNPADLANLNADADR